MNALSPLETIFFAALERAPAERPAYLDEACAGDPDMRRRVDKMLAAQSQAGSFLESPPPAETADLPVREGPGTVIGPYKLLEPIGEGGFGVVYLAEQTEPVRRKVALKVLKPGMDSQQVVARFEAERQALAIMDHPNIAKVHDGGVIPPAYAGGSPRPYFVMELVKGVPITEYCDEHRLSPRQRLELFVSVCHAVQHAHQKGIIHRDLKPSNVLVSRHDTTPVVKVIDFGVAKALGQSLTDKTLFTGVAQMVGTPLYMSPEQAGMSDLDVDTRSDIYSLGVLLYELLTGTTPFTRERFRQAAYDEIRRIIREEEPPKPSTRLSDSTASLPSISAQRQTEPAKLTRLVRGELDWIVMKALEKDRNRRYETANGFAMDVQRYLAGEVVQACPPSAGYRLRKFARRNKGALVTASVLGAALLLAVGSLGWMVRDRQSGRARTTVEVNQFLQRAESLYAGNRLPEAVAEVQKARGVLEAGRGDEELGRRVRQWLTDLDTAAKLEEIRLEWYDRGSRDREDVDYARVFRDHGTDVDTLSEEEASARVAASPIRLDLVMALTAWAVQLKRDSRPQNPARWQRLEAIARAADPDPWRLRLVEAVEAGDVRTLKDLANEADLGRMRTRILAELGSSLTTAGEAESAVAFLRKVQRRHPGDLLVNSALAYGLGHLNPPRWDESLAFRRVALAASPQSAWAHVALGLVLLENGRLDDAIIAFRDAITINPKYDFAHNDLGVALGRQNKLVEAIAAYREASRLNPKSIYALNNLAVALLAQNKPDDAIAAVGEAIRIQPGHAPSHFNLGNALDRLRKLDDAIAAWREAVRLKPDFADAHFNLGIALRRQGKHDDAIAAYHDAVRAKPDFAVAHISLGDALCDKGRHEDAVDALRKAISLNRDNADAHNSLGWTLARMGRVEEAIAAYESAIHLEDGSLRPRGNLAWLLVAGPDPKYWDGKRAVELMNKVEMLGGKTALSRRHLGLAHYRAGNWKESRAALEEATKLTKGGDGCHGCLWFFLAMTHHRLGDRPEARRWYDRAAEWMDKNKLKDDELRRFRAEAAKLLGVAVEVAPPPREKK